MKHIELIIYSLILLATAYIDFKKMIIPNIIPCLIILLSIFYTREDIFSSILGFIIVPLPFFIGALVKEGGIGGGDIKFLAANGFFLGVTKGIYASIIGSIVAIVIQIIYCKIFKKQSLETPFALGPYLALGCFLMYLN